MQNKKKTNELYKEEKGKWEVRILAAAFADVRDLVRLGGCPFFSSFSRAYKTHAFSNPPPPPPPKSVGNKWRFSSMFSDGYKSSKIIFLCYQDLALTKKGRDKTFLQDYWRIYVTSITQHLHFHFFMMIQWAAQDYDSFSWFIILLFSSDASDFVRNLQLIFFTIFYTH